MLLSAGAAAAVAAGLSACGSVIDREPDLVAGKEAFIERCGSCHVLNRAGSQGIQGPNLDTAFEQAIDEGIKRSTIEGVVARQIELPNPDPQVDPRTGKDLSAMPADLVTGKLVDDVAAYVASVSSREGEDSGRLASVGGGQAEGTAEAENGKLEIPADPSGQLIYEFADAMAPAGELAISSPNEASVDHNIALEGMGVDEVGPVVNNGGVSDIDVTVEKGEYTFYCSVPGHREQGMEGTLTIEG